MSGTYRPPSDTVAHMSPTANWDGFERRCCPNCRLYFDATEDSGAVFCSQACERRHERGELKADGGNGRLIAEWRERPYTAHDRRAATVYHRVMLYVFDHGVDIEHQAKGDDQAAIPPEWNPVNVWEVRNGRVSKLRRQEVLRS
jgi:hypothetical protein